MKTEVRVRIYARDRELRAWLVDELALMSSSIAAQADDVLDATGAQLVIVGADALTLAELEYLRALTIPVIAIGAPANAHASMSFAYLLDARLTSRQLKRAVREVLGSPVNGVTSLQPA